MVSSTSSPSRSRAPESISRNGPPVVSQDNDHVFRRSRTRGRALSAVGRRADARRGQQARTEHEALHPDPSIRSHADLGRKGDSAFPMSAKAVPQPSSLRSVYNMRACRSHRLPRVRAGRTPWRESHTRGLGPNETNIAISHCRNAFTSSVPGPVPRPRRRRRYS